MPTAAPLRPRAHYTRIAIPQDAADEIRRAAARCGLTMASYLRLAALAYARAGLSPAPKQSDPTDAPPPNPRKTPLPAEKAHR